MPRLLDLFCGRWGWSKAFAKRGWECEGIDLIEPPETPKNCYFRMRDVLTINRLYADQFDFACISSPCEEFSLFQIRNFHPDPPYPAMGIKLFNHARALVERAGIPYVQENVRAAQRFVGDAVNHSGSFFLWGTAIPPLIPKGLTKGMKMDRKWCRELGGHGTKQRDAQTASFATIPPELANCVADYAERLLEARNANLS